MKLPTNEAGIRKHILENWQVDVAVPRGETLSSLRKLHKESHASAILVGSNDLVVEFIVEDNLNMYYDFLEEIPAKVRATWKAVLERILEEKVRAKWKSLNKE